MISDVLDLQFSYSKRQSYQTKFQSRDYKLSRCQTSFRELERLGVKSTGVFNPFIIVDVIILTIHLIYFVVSITQLKASVTSLTQ